MPKRASAGEADSLHTDVDGETCTNQAFVAPEMAGGDLAFGIKNGMRQSECRLPMHGHAAASVEPGRCTSVGSGSDAGSAGDSAGIEVGSLTPSMACGIGVSPAEQSPSEMQHDGPMR